MPEVMKKLRTENIELTVTGPAKNRTKAIRALADLGFADTTDSVPWREAFPDHDVNNEPGICLSGARTKEGMTQKELSKLTGIPQRHISEMENGKRTIGKKTARLLERALKISYKVFL